ncbi:MAG: hypothetical protein E5V25_04305 [Mesorhizobium sp.]|uniref:hypothetical protein n=1 Tax=Mesorhizobium sp. TaxID=1871066 RepID=UPI000FEA1FB4|nr:hypothetical protein [Mesorhizobium sp.]RWD80463.1 MAG: hypothetical protein EOS48_17935 [Mesorhizobium sp.]TIS37417.1 MAG: hypothetical protein E5W95_17505 [Mesorhizobium sp.]TIX73907.1 MAG: hypothetical protein E5V25_04305 [Mesorhizobium sp.]
MDYYLDDETWQRLVDYLAGPHDPAAQGWTRRDEVIEKLGEVGVWPASINCQEAVQMATN